MSSEKLGTFLQEVANWDWREYVLAEGDKTYSSNQAIIFALIRACAMQKLPAIKVAVSRLDGKLKTPIKIEMPKVYHLYPYAKLAAPDVPAQPSLEKSAQFAVVTSDPETVNEVVTGELMMPQRHEPQGEPKDLPSMNFRETLAEMGDYPRELPEAIIQLALQTEQALRNQAPMPAEVPKVKSVVAAHLLTMAQNRNLDAITEVFDQIDGKLVETLQILGEDIYITMFATTAPPGAIVNEDGVLQIEATQSQEIWANKLGKEKPHA